ncbi:hypothetical protein BJ165DRAFT_825879 [Panaeolus papilionaceus]|nr:hypothetical protein BJ165DRAFT_825879 [Panaeolus papilionaceus]
MVAFLVPFLQFVAFLLLLLATVSTPVTKTIYLFQLAASASSNFFKSGVNGSIRFGVWGYCLSAIQVSVAGFNRSTDPRCSPKRLGYTFDSTISNALNIDNIEDAISRTTTAALVLHPIATALTFLTLLTCYQCTCRLLHYTCLPYRRHSRRCRSQEYQESLR